MLDSEIGAERVNTPVGVRFESRLFFSDELLHISQIALVFVQLSLYVYQVVLKGLTALIIVISDLLLLGFDGTFVSGTMYVYNFNLD